MSDRLSEIKEREAKATPGPWIWFHSQSHPEHWEVDGKSELMPGHTGWQILGGVEEPDGPEDYGWAVLHGKHSEDEITPSLGDVAFAASARQDIPWLVSEVERLTAENARLRAFLDEILTHPADCHGIVAADCLDSIRERAKQLKGQP